jgi:hypothetical protein
MSSVRDSLPIQGLSQWYRESGFPHRNPGRYSRRGKDGQSGVGVAVAGRRWGRTSGDNLDHGEADLAGIELDR